MRRPKPPPFAVANRLARRIEAFLQERGGPYTWIGPRLEETILLAIATGQYVIGIDRQGIQYFAAFWLLDDAARDMVLAEAPEDRCRPAQFTAGSHVYVAEAACRPGFMSALVSKIRRQCAGKQGALWHRPLRKRTHHYPNQKGGVAHGQQ